MEIQGSLDRAWNEGLNMNTLAINQYCAIGGFFLRGWSPPFKRQQCETVVCKYISAPLAPSFVEIVQTDKETISKNFP